MTKNKELIATASIFLSGSCFTIFANIVIILLILRKRQLWHIRFYIIASLAVADIITLLMLIIMVFKIIFHVSAESVENQISTFFVIPKVIGLASHISSLLTLAFLAFDRYIAVQHSLSYQKILTKKRMIIIMVTIWLFSLSISGMNWINVSIYFEYHRNLFITLTVFRVITSVLLLTLSKHTNIMRKKHMNQIKRKKQYFGVAKEKLDILKTLKRSLEESFKLYIATVVVLVASTIAGIVQMVVSDYFFEIDIIMMLLLHIVDVIVLALSQGDIRKTLKYMNNKIRVAPM